MKWLRRLRVFTVLLLLGGIAAAALPVAADTIVQSFQASGSIPPAWVVGLKPGTTNTVELAPANQSEKVYGVAIDPSEAPVTLQRQSNQQVFVATNGTYPVLVSTQNGNINPGDYLSISSTDGIAAKATDTQTFVLGRASQKFDGSSNVLSSGGGFSIGKISAIIQPQANPTIKDDIAIPSPIRKVGNSIAGKEVSPLRIYGGLAVFVVAALIAISTLIAGIRSSMISIGRNPLSKNSILRALAQVLAVSLLVLILGIIGVYLLLRL